MRKFLAVFLSIVICLCLAVGVAADTFVASITAKPAPEVVAVDGNPVLEIKDETGKVVASVETIQLVVTPVSTVMNEETAEEISEESAEELKKVYEELSDKNVDLVEIMEGLDVILEEQKVDAANLVVKDLFNVTIDDEAVAAYLNEEGNTIDIAFKADIQEGQFVTVAVYKDGKWILAKNVVVNEDGTIVATLEYLGPVAIIVA